jgi:hypothetical protein
VYRGRFIEEIGVMDAAVQGRVEEILSSISSASHVPRVIVRSGWYYQER